MEEVIVFVGRLPVLVLKEPLVKVEVVFGTKHRGPVAAVVRAVVMVGLQYRY